MGRLAKALTALTTDTGVDSAAAGVYTPIVAALGAPVLNAPTTATTGGTLPAATYFYVITAVNANGETLKSNEQSQATTGTTSTVSLGWTAVTGATGYKVYRSTATGTQTLLATLGAVTSYTDTGSATPGTAAPPTEDTTNSDSLSITGAGGVKGRVAIHAKNTAATAKTCTVRKGTRQSAPGNAELVVSVPASGERMIVLGDSVKYERADESYHVDFEAGTTGTVAFYRIPSR